MAKGYGLTGKVRGKIGSTVFRIESGKQIISEYNPTKTGAPTEKQLLVRSRMTLANSVSRIVPYPCIIGLGSSPAKARHAFVGRVFEATTAVMADETSATATLTAANLKFSDGVNVGVIRANTLDTAGTYTRAKATVTYPVNQNVIRFLMIAIWHNTSTNEFVIVDAVLSSEVSDTGEATATSFYSTSTAVANMKAYVYAIPIVLNTLGKRVKYDELQLDSSTNVFTADMAVTFTRHNMYGATKYIGISA